MRKTRRKTSRKSQSRRKPRPNMIERVKNGRANTKFKKGNAGRPKGAKDKIPGGRGIKASVKAIIEEVVTHQGTTIKKAFMDGIRGGPRNSHHYLRMMAEYMDGKPVDTVNLNAKFNENELQTAKDRLDKRVSALAAQLLRKAADEPSGEGG